MSLIDKSFKHEAETKHQLETKLLASDMILKTLFDDRATFCVGNTDTVTLKLGESYKGVKLKSIQGGSSVTLEANGREIQKRL